MLKLRCDCETPPLERCITGRCSGEEFCGVVDELEIFLARAGKQHYD